jgi:rhodanese-related sulfurtransferase
MTYRLPRMLGIVLALALVSTYAATAMAAEVPMITKEELLAMMSSKNVVIADVRTNEDWTASDTKIKGAFRVTPSNLDSWAAGYPKDATIVFY